LKVANDDVVSYKNSNEWLIHHPKEALVFKNLENVWQELKVIYNGNFKDLVYGPLPKETAVFATLKIIQGRLKKMTWSIKIETAN
jgi:hypothetical protein